MNPQHQSTSPRQVNRRVHTPADTKDSPPPEGARRVTRSQETRSKVSRCKGSPGKSPRPVSRCEGRVSWARPAAPERSNRGSVTGLPLYPPLEGGLWAFQVAQGAPTRGTSQPQGTDMAVIGSFCRARPLVPALCQPQGAGTATPRQTEIEPRGHQDGHWRLLWPGQVDFLRGSSYGATFWIVDGPGMAPLVPSSSHSTRGLPAPYPTPPHPKKMGGGTAGTADPK